MTFGQWIGLLVLGVCLYILWEIRQVLLLVFLAVVLATALNWLQLRLQSWGLQRGRAIALSMSLTFLIIFGFFWMMIPPFLQEAQQLGVLIPKGLGRVEAWLDDMAHFLPSGGFDDTPMINRLITQLEPFLQQIFNNFFALFSNTLALLLNTLLVLVLTVMLVIDPQPYRRGFIRLFPAFYRSRIDTILRESEQALLAWLAGTGLNMVVIGVVSGLTLALLGVRLVLANAFLAGLLEAIPNIGPALSVIPPMIIAFIDDPWRSVAVLMSYILIQQLEQYLLVPLVMAKQVALLPAVTLVSQIIFATFFGFLGLLLALPLVIVGQIWFTEIVLKDILDRWQASPPPEASNPPILPLPPGIPPAAASPAASDPISEDDSVDQ
ncbi:AI-2E family transporter [Thermosynechococcus vestitus]|uniref:Tlr1549 protein n=1 Tax=Thermosynechococcus vestitus (strain NIES-2133 / IAM M-273 / BP-1) TaxID=197221 RepID=Q8DIN3_THEVB|nr:AI-2E family transporter [Thermosynechococcus vestitus]BAC09101.1 tlr1549 [Thermosynechococcus vestitus BP-1]